MGFAKRSLGLFPLLLLVRLFELTAVGPTPGVAEAIARGVLDDFAFTGLVSAFLAVPLIALGAVRPRPAATVHRAILVVVVLVAVGLSRYFSITRVPLGADLWGYSPSELVETSAASAGGWTVVIPFLIAAAIAWFALGESERAGLRGRTLAIVSGVAVACGAGRAWIAPQPRQFTDEVSYFLALDKPAHFAARTLRYVIDEARSPSLAFSEYPLLKAPVTEDVLGPLLAKSDRRPNIVFLIVEGLGRDFVGAGAEYGGFTPFIDSLTTRGLFWPNFLANTGRTYGVIPSMLGSLPFARGGFMSLGDRMPAHLTLIRWLRENGYATSYFTGTSGSFDQIDTFMDRQGVGRFSDESSFPANIQKQPGGAGGYTWGYGDRDMLGYSLEQLGPSALEPRLDVYLTITTHEPFIPPNPAAYRERFAARLQALDPPAPRRRVYEDHANVFSTLLYLDDAVAFFLAEYAKRPEYSRTIFVVTGDHRLIPIPFSTALSRYRVPFLIVSPLVKAPHTMRAVSSHLDVTPTFAAYLSKNYGLPLPSRVPWLGSGIDTATTFRNTHAIPLMRSKNELDDFLKGLRLLSGDRVFALTDDLQVDEIEAPAMRDSLRSNLSAFRQLNRFVSSGEHIYPQTPAEAAERRQRLADDSTVRSLDLDELTPEAQLTKAHELGEAREFHASRAILRRLLRKAPMYHDARVILGRTFAWETRFDTARVILDDVIHRAPTYVEGHVARIDVEIWDSIPSAAMPRIVSASAQFGRVAELQYAKARTLELMGRKAEALAALDSALRLKPNLEGAGVVRARLLR